MAFGTPATLAAEHGQAPGTPSFFIRVSFPGDGAYSAGGTAGFQTFLRAAVDGRAVEIIDIIPGDCGGYIPVYDKTNDKLKVYEQTDTATSPLIETVTADLSGTTFNLTAVCK
jgi:hypothetical protein